MNAMLERRSTGKVVNTTTTTTYNYNYNYNNVPTRQRLKVATSAPRADVGFYHMKMKASQPVLMKAKKENLVTKTRRGGQQEEEEEEACTKLSTANTASATNAKGAQSPPPPSPPQQHHQQQGFDALVFLQTASGAWSLDQALADALGIALSDLVQALPEQGKEKEWATALAVVALEVQYPEKQTVWQMICMKAKRFLASHQQCCDNYIALARNVIQRD
eukprot:GEZU01018672.1.p1 GENE.GEZU01018672.1~~GEZU01018672.1.p1  ORF type:complete len:219 (+),score=68.06 GEZU01018672.1:363-1019(+)